MYFFNKVSGAATFAMLQMLQVQIQNGSHVLLWSCRECVFFLLAAGLSLGSLTLDSELQGHTMDQKE